MGLILTMKRMAFSLLTAAAIATAIMSSITQQTSSVQAKSTTHWHQTKKQKADLASMTKKYSVKVASHVTYNEYFKLTPEKLMMAGDHVQLSKYVVRVIKHTKAGNERHMLISPKKHKSHLYSITDIPNKSHLRKGSVVTVKGSIQNAGKNHDDNLPTKWYGHKTLFMSVDKISRNKY